MDAHILKDLGNGESEALKARFLAAGMRLMRIAKSAGYRIIPTTDVRLPLFSALPLQQQMRTVETVEVATRIYTSMIESESDLRDNSAVVWSAFRELGLIPPSDFFDKVGSEDAIELYSEDHVQLFANFRFFELCSYTLEEIYSLPWHVLWSRPDECAQRLLTAIDQIRKPDCKSTVMLNESPHSILELASAFKYELSYLLRGIAALLDQRTKERVGYIVIERVELTSKRDIQQEERALASLVQSWGRPDLSIV